MDGLANVIWNKIVLFNKCVDGGQGDIKAARKGGQ